jgi:hypothetical protein
VSWDLAVWEGEMPEPTEASDRYAELLEAYEEELENDPPAPPTPALSAFLTALVERLPNSVDTGPWSFVPVSDEASGPLVILHVQWDGVDRVLEVVPALAREHGLVCYDPQAAALLQGRPT